MAWPRPALQRSFWLLLSRFPVMRHAGCMVFGIWAKPLQLDSQRITHAHSPACLSMAGPGADYDGPIAENGGQGQPGTGGPNKYQVPKECMQRFHKCHRLYGVADLQVVGALLSTKRP